MIPALILAWLAFVAGVMVGLWLARAPECTCGDVDCGGGCIEIDWEQAS